MKHYVIAHDVPAQTKSERKRAKNMRRKLDDEHERRKPEHRPQEVLEISDPVSAETRVVIINKHERAEREGRVEIVGRRKKSGNQSQKIRNKDENEKRSDDRIVNRSVMMTDHAFGEIVEALGDDFEKVFEGPGRIGN